MAEHEQIEKMQIPIVLELDKEGTFPLSQHVWVTFDEHHLYVRFYQIVAPVILDGTPPVSVPAKLVATVSWPAEGIPSLVRVFQETGHKYEEATGRPLAWTSEVKDNDERDS